MSKHPYENLPEYAYWRRAVANVDPTSMNTVVTAQFRISAEDRVATAGSCFSLHLSRYLRDCGLNHFVSESAHPMVSRQLAEEYGYGLFTARYGNIYTSRQLLQLFDRAYGEFSPREDVWQGADGALIDPFRPQIQPGGFVAQTEYQADRRRHFRAVRRAFEGLDVLFFTLGLTECWASRDDGATYPLCPGVAGGEFNSSRHRFVNLTVDDVSSDLKAFVVRLRQVNPRARIILSVSPVPMIATAEDRHILTSNTYSKSVLRVAAETVARSCRDVAYFPSYEIVTGSFSRGSYYGEDCRSVRQEGIDHVMRLFLQHYADVALDRLETDKRRRQARSRDDHLTEMERLVAAHCDEEVLDLAVAG